MSLQLQSFRLPDGDVVRFFASVDGAVRHLLAHVLSMPEGAWWAVIEPGFRELGDVEAFRFRDAMRRALSDEREHEASQQLYLTYLAAARRAIEDAYALGWWAEDPDGARAHLSPLGVVVILEPAPRSLGVAWVTVTAYVGAQSTPEAVRAHADASRRFARDRDDRMRPRRERGREAHARARREASWSEEERLFYEVFRPAVRVIRETHLVRGPGERRGPLRTVALLKARVPRGRLDFDAWRALREELSS